MKIEKLTENKIRIVVNSSDLKLENLNIHQLMRKTLEGQSFFLLDILEKAKKEVGFNTDGCRLLIEMFSSFDDIFVFTITKYSKEKKKSFTKRKSCSFNKNFLWKFDDFDEFCEFCEYLNNNFHFDMKPISDKTSLLLYNNTYYLIVKNSKIASEYTKAFSLAALEFRAPLSTSDIFESKILEHGKAIMKKNAVLTGIKYFC